MPPNNTTINPNLAEWLARRGLRNNPFAIPNAEADPNLPHYYVDTVLFDELLQLTQPCVIFGNRGSGKSAQRQMLAAQCRPLQPDSDYLAINYTYKEYVPVLDTVDDNANDKLIRDKHIEKIMEYATRSLADEIEKDKGLSRFLFDNNKMRPEIASYLIHYCPTHPVREFFPYSQSSNLLGGRSNPEILEGFTNLIRSVNLKRCLVLLDGLDESPLSDFGILAFLRPLLGTLPIIESPGLAFKFSLPRDWEPLLRSESWFRPDRLRIFYTEWTEENLQELISLRFAYFAEPGQPPYTQLAELCDEPLAPDIDAELIHLAQGSPRNVLLLADLLFRIHCRQPPIAERITDSVWGKTKIEWIRQQGVTEISLGPTQPEVESQSDSGLPTTTSSWPPLRVEETGLVWLGREEIRNKLTRKEYLVLSCLHKHQNGVCGRDDIAEEAWPDAKDPGAVTDEQISTQIRRLRQKLGQKKAKEGGYIETIRGDGYRLHLDGFGKKPGEESKIHS